MEGTSAKGVLGHLSFLEAQARSRRPAAQPQSRAAQLKAKVEELKKEKDRLRAEIQVHQSLQKLRTSVEETNADDSETSEILRLMAKHTELKDVLLAHHLLGGYDVISTNQERSLCVSLPTSFQGVMLDTYHVELDVKQTVRVARHSAPPFIPVERLAQDADLQKDVRGFLDTLSLHLNAFVARRQQLRLVKELHRSVEVLESNAPCSLLVLMLTVPKKTTLLCSLEYSDHSRSLPSSVRIQSEEGDLSESAVWKKNMALLRDTPVHEALAVMRKTGHIL